MKTATIVGVSCTILVLLFLAQPFGTTKLAGAFAPIVIIWLLFNLCCGIYNLAMFDHTVLKAFSPYYAGQFFVRNKEQGWRTLGGLLLAFTGVEALFADLGAFSKRAIQLSWLAFAFPCLLLAYIGQAAFIAQDVTGTAFANPFFNTVPPGTFYFSLVIAILAASKFLFRIPNFPHSLDYFRPLQNMSSESTILKLVLREKSSPLPSSILKLVIIS